MIRPSFWRSFVRLFKRYSKMSTDTVFSVLLERLPVSSGNRVGIQIELRREKNSAGERMYVASLDDSLCVCDSNGKDCVSSLGLQSATHP